MSLKGAETAGLSLDQAPPLAIPTAFFALVPLALITAGVLLVVRGGDAVGSHWAPTVMAAVHVGTVGVLGSAMLGAVAAGIQPTVEAAMGAMSQAGEVVEPASEVAEEYGRRYRVFGRMYEDQVAYRELMGK